LAQSIPTAGNPDARGKAPLEITMAGSCSTDSRLPRRGLRVHVLVGPL